MKFLCFCFMNYYEFLKLSFATISIVLPCARLRELILVSDQSSYDHFYELPKWSFTRASTVLVTFGIVPALLGPHPTNPLPENNTTP